MATPQESGHRPNLREARIDQMFLNTVTHKGALLLSRRRVYEYEQEYGRSKHADNPLPEEPLVALGFFEDYWSAAFEGFRARFRMDREGSHRSHKIDPQKLVAQTTPFVDVDGVVGEINGLFKERVKETNNGEIPIFTPQEEEKPEPENLIPIQKTRALLAFDHTVATLARMRHTSMVSLYTLQSPFVREVDYEMARKTTQWGLFDFSAELLYRQMEEFRDTTRAAYLDSRPITHLNKFANTIHFLAAGEQIAQSFTAA